MSLCLWILVVTAVVVAYLVVSPPQRQIGQFNPDNPDNLESLGISLNRLDKARYINTAIKGTQDIEVDNEGYAYTGLSDGSLIKIDTKTQKIEKIGQYRGQILGLALSESEKNLAVATEDGLVLFNLKEKTSKILVSGFKNVKFSSLNSVTFAGQDRLYFVVSGTISMDQLHKQLLYRSGDGQLYQHDISANKTKLLLNTLQFPNGIGYSKKENCLYLNELTKHRILKIGLTGANFLKKTVIIRNLLGYPDNLKINQDGHIWVGTPSLRDQVTNTIEKYSLFRKILLNLKVPGEIFMKMANTKYSGGIKIDPKNGKIIDYFYGKPDDIYFITTINQKNGRLYFSSLLCDKIGVIDYQIPGSNTQQKQNQEQL